MSKKPVSIFNISLLKDKYNSEKQIKFIDRYTSSIKELVYGEYEVFGEDNSYGGMWDKPEIPNLGRVIGNQLDALHYALDQKRFFSWGSGGEIHLKRTLKKPNDWILAEIDQRKEQIKQKQEEIRRLQNEINDLFNYGE